MIEEIIAKERMAEKIIEERPVKEAMVEERTVEEPVAEERIAKAIQRKGTQQEIHYDLNGNIFEVPTFSMREIHDAIPKHCFHPSVWRSMSHVARDFCLVGITGYAASNIHLLPSMYVRLLAWIAYGIIQGIFGTGVWILAHECGHGAFSELKWLNNVMGIIMHSMLLVPFHSWRLSHRQHHKATGNLQRDVVFIPRSRQSWIQKRYGKSADPAELQFSSIVEDAPLTIAWKLLVHQLLGWPLYLFLNITGQKYEGSIWKKNHFYFGNDSPLFREDDSKDILISDISIFVALLVMYFVIMRFGFLNWCLYYGAPYLWVNNWIVLITFLQHTDASLPHYDNGVWTFALGASATIDRDFGFIGRNFFHHLIETHVLHHLVSSIPHYHAQEATLAIRKVMGTSYNRDADTNILVAFWQTQRSCKFVEESVKGSGVVFYRNLHGVGVKPKVLTEA